MPQLMPMMWILSVFMIVLLVLVFVNMYSFMFIKVVYFLKKFHMINYSFKW